MGFLKELKVFGWITRQAGLSHFEYSRNGLRTSRALRLRTVAFILISTGTLIMGYFQQIYFMGHGSFVSSAVEGCRVVGIRIVHLLSLVEALCVSEKMMLFFKRLSAVDELIEKYTHVNPNKCSKFKVTHLVHFSLTTLLYLVTELYTFVVFLILDRPKYVQYYIFYFIPLVSCAIRYMQVVVTVIAIKIRLDIISDSFQKLGDSTHIRPGPRFLNVVSNVEPIEHCHFIQETFSELWELIKSINQCFGVSLLASLTNDFISLTANVYYVFLGLKIALEFHGTLLWLTSSVVSIIPHVYNILTICCVCHWTVESAENILQTAQKMKPVPDNEEHNTFIRHFLLQLMHQKIKFSANGFFTINLSVIYQMTGIIATYVVILIQFYMSEEIPEIEYPWESVFNETENFTVDGLLVELTEEEAFLGL